MVNALDWTRIAKCSVYRSEQVLAYFPASREAGISQCETSIFMRIGPHECPERCPTVRRICPSDGMDHGSILESHIRYACKSQRREADMDTNTTKTGPVAQWLLPIALLALLFSVNTSAETLRVDEHRITATDQ